MQMIVSNRCLDTITKIPTFKTVILKRSNCTCRCFFILNLVCFNNFVLVAAYDGHRIILSGEYEAINKIINKKLSRFASNPTMYI